MALKGKSDIGDQINKKIIALLVDANTQLSRSDFPDFNDPVKLGSGKEKIERLTNLVAIFENPALDFSKNRAGDDDLLGDAYEYLMRNFATESGKSKGQFYTPAEVSRVMAQVLEIGSAHATNNTTVYDPTCGSGSLLLKVADEAHAAVTLYGQEKDAATSGLARMNLILHNNPTAIIQQGNTITDPKFIEKGLLQTFDFVVANPPFSDKRWSTGLDPQSDPHGRFTPFGTPPAKQGDYAYLLHIVRSLKSTGRGACILPHGVLFRGNSEAEIRKNLIRRGYIKGIIGLPPNLFYGTGIPACIVVVEKQNAENRQGIFIIDASKGFKKDGPKNRLRDQDIHKIVDVFTHQMEIPKYARLVSFEEIEKNEFNLNIPRYIDSQEKEDIQDIEAHLRGGIPERDIDALEVYWKVFPQLRQTLFKVNRPGYLDLAVENLEIRTTIYEHPEFLAFNQKIQALFDEWKTRVSNELKALQIGVKPKEMIANLSNDLLVHYTERPLIDPYAIYQHLMDYWTETMQDDCYQIAASGWKAETYRILEKDKKGNEKDKGWACDLIPKTIIVERYFRAEQETINNLMFKVETLSKQMIELVEEEGEEGIFADLEKINQKTVLPVLKETRALYKVDKVAYAADLNNLEIWVEMYAQVELVKEQIKVAKVALDKHVLEKYPTLSEEEVKTLVVDDKWLTNIKMEIDHVINEASQLLALRIGELSERYCSPLPVMSANTKALEEKVIHHLMRMGFTW